MKTHDTHNTHRLRAILGALMLAVSALLLTGCAEDEDDTIVYKYVTEYTYTAGESQSVALSYEFDITGGFGVTTSSLTFGEDTFTFDWADEAELTNNDTSGTWWDGTTASLAISKGDFALRFAWRNSRDTSYSDVVLELFDGASNSWDWTFGSEVSDIWGDLADAALAIEGCYTEAVWDSDEGEYVVDEDATWVTPGTADAFGGNYEVVCVRVDSTLIVNATVLRSADNSIATYTIVTSGFSADTLSALLTGNPYFIDDVTWTYDENLDGTVTTGGDASSTASDSDYDAYVVYTVDVSDTTFGTVDGAALDITGDSNVYVIDSYSVNGVETSVNLSANCSSWWATHYVIGESSIRTAMSSANGDTYFQDAVTLSEDNTTIKVKGTSTSDGSANYYAPTLVILANGTSASYEEMAVLRSDWYSWGSGTISATTSDSIGSTYNWSIASLVADCTWEITIKRTSSTTVSVTFGFTEN